MYFLQLDVLSMKDNKDMKTFLMNDECKYQPFIYNSAQDSQKKS